MAAALPGWLSQLGPDSDLVLSCRVRLARNLHNHQFVRIAPALEREKIFKTSADAMIKCETLKEAELLELDKMEELDQMFLLERHLISPDMQRQKGARGVAVNPEQTLGIMVNEEDHLRLQYIQPGFSPTDSWNVLNKIDDELSHELSYAFSKRWGYLTACPTNAGTGLRVSVLIHLPGLVLTKNIEKVIRGITQLGLTVRGFYGEGSEVIGNLFQISNQTTLGKQEADIIKTIEKVIQQIMGYERDACGTLLDEAKPQIEDKIWRACGILNSARLMNFYEFMNISSAVRLGIALDVIKNVKLETLNELMIQLQPASLQIISGCEMGPTERDRLRAELVRERLGSC